METTINNTVTTVNNGKRTDYKKDVNETNKKLKELVKTLGGARKHLLDNAKDIELNENFIKFLELTIGQSDVNNKAYKVLQKATRTTAKEKVPVYYVLQSCNWLTNAKIENVFINFDADKITLEQLEVLLTRANKKADEAAKNAAQAAKDKEAKEATQKRNTESLAAKLAELEKVETVYRSKLVTAQKALEKAGNKLKRAGNNEDAKKEAQEEAQAATETANFYSLKAMATKDYIETLKAVKGDKLAPELLERVVTFLQS
jgi:arsenate reductase-like glutaredoxin family protein